MSRRIGVVAWMLATVMSVVASTAAVTSVRAQVTDRPDIVSLAALRRATSTTSTTVGPPSPLAGPTSSTTPTSVVAQTTTTTRPEIVATPATTVETTSTTTTTTSPAPPLPSGEEHTRTFRGGTVTVSFDGESVRLVEALPEEGYRLSIEEQNDHTVDLRFVQEGRSSGYRAQVVNGRLEIRVID